MFIPKEVGHFSRARIINFSLKIKFQTQNRVQGSHISSLHLIEKELH